MYLLSHMLKPSLSGIQKGKEIWRMFLWAELKKEERKKVMFHLAVRVENLTLFLLMFSIPNQQSFLKNVWDTLTFLLFRTPIPSKPTPIRMFFFFFFLVVDNLVFIWTNIVPGRGKGKSRKEKNIMYGQSQINFERWCFM